MARTKMEWIKKNSTKKKRAVSGKISFWVQWKSVELPSGSGFLQTFLSQRCTNRWTALIAFFLFFFQWRIIMNNIMIFCFSEDGAVHVFFCISRIGITFPLWSSMTINSYSLTFRYAHIICFMHISQLSTKDIKIAINYQMLHGTV